VLQSARVASAGGLSVAGQEGAAYSAARGTGCLPRAAATVTVRPWPPGHCGWAGLLTTVGWLPGHCALGHGLPAHRRRVVSTSGRGRDPGETAASRAERAGRELGLALRHVSFIPSMAPPLLLC
jgi:hypothetical protein